jgi:hypothetical protein
MSIRNQTRIRVELERAIMPENQRQISGGQCVPCTNLPQVRVIDEETDQAQEERRSQRLQAKASRPFG